MSISYDPSFEIGLEFSRFAVSHVLYWPFFSKYNKDTLSEYANVAPK